MSAFSRRVAEVSGVAEDRLERLAGEGVSEVLLVPRPNGVSVVAKSGSAVAAEAAMLRTIAAAGVPAPTVEGEHEGVLLLEHVENDALFSATCLDRYRHPHPEAPWQDRRQLRLAGRLCDRHGELRQS